jgi:hypothetical protein
VPRGDATVTILLNRDVTWLICIVAGIWLSARGTPWASAAEARFLISRTGRHDARLNGAGGHATVADGRYTAR